MRLAYVLTWSKGSRSGVFKKVADQVNAWSSSGVEVGLFVGSSVDAAAEWASLPQTRHVSRFTSGLSSIAVQRAVLGAARHWQPDLTYIRTTPRHAAAPDILRSLPHVVEVQSDDLAEARLISRPRTWVSLATRGICHGSARGLVFVSHELAASPSYARFTGRRIVIGNGIDLRRVTTLPPAPPHGSPRVVFMGHPGQPWHGIDDVFALARARPDWIIDLVGMSHEPGSPGTPNLRFHGELTAEQYLPILAQADLGLGSLALYRNGMEEASPLKVREYLALGLPVVGGYRDTDIPSDSPVFLRVGNRPGGVVQALPQVESFLDTWRGRRVQQDDIRYLDTSVKEEQRLAFLLTCSQSREGRPSGRG